MQWKPDKQRNIINQRFSHIFVIKYFFFNDFFLMYKKDSKTHMESGQINVGVHWLGTFLQGLNQHLLEGGDLLQVSLDESDVGATQSGEEKRRGVEEVRRGQRGERRVEREVGKRGEERRERSKKKYRKKRQDTEIDEMKINGERITNLAQL